MEFEDELIVLFQRGNESDYLALGISGFKM